MKRYMHVKSISVPPSSFADRRHAVQCVANQTNTYGNLGMPWRCGGANAHGADHSEGKGNPARQCLQSSDAVPPLHARVKTPIGPSLHSPRGSPGCRRNIVCHMLSSDSQP